MFINGQWEEAEEQKSFNVFNPASTEIIGTVPDGGRKETLYAIESAYQAFKKWSLQTAHQRSTFLYDAHQLMMENLESLARVMTQEQGKPLPAARNEVKYGADFLLWFAEEAKRNYGRTIPSARADQRFLVLKQPVGVVAAITPWNYPVSMVTRKIAPALAAGCTIVLKPAEDTPLCAVEVFKLLEKAGLPAGVANLVTTKNPAPVGELFVTDPRIRKITFTGSTAVGKLLARKAAGNMKRISLELGGHAPFIVCRDADPTIAAKGLSLVKFLNTGQACICPNRIFVQKSMKEQFISVLQSRVSKMKAGSGLDAGISIGPLVNQQAIDKIDNQVQDAVQKGASVISGGYRIEENGLDAGCFYSPTILDNVDESMLIYREETFGPIAPIITYEDESELIQQANDTDYGLAAYIYTRDMAKAMKLYEALNFGIIGVNDINPTAASAPFGGMKNSGIGREGAVEGLDEYLENKLVGISIR